jgi:hypothetical protein
VSFVPSNVYTFRRSVVNPTAVTNLQIKAAAAKPIVVLAFGVVATTANTTNTTIAVQLGRIPTTFGTVTAAVAADITTEQPGSGTTAVQLGTAATGYTATGEPTYTDTWAYEVNVLGPLDKVYLPEERKVFAAATGVGLKTLLAPPAGTYTFYITYAEIG